LYAAYVHDNHVLCDMPVAVEGEPPLAIRLCSHVYNSEADLISATEALRDG